MAAKFRQRSLISLLVATTLGIGGMAHAQDDITLGGIFMMSGSAAAYGKFAQQGSTLALEEINKNGGVLGKELKIKFEDSEGKPATAIQAARKLAFQEGAVGLMGIDSSGVAQGLVPVVPELGIPLIITHAATPDVTGKDCNSYSFRVSVNVNQNMKGAALVAADTGAKKWTTIGPDYAFGHQSWEFFGKYLKELNDEVELSSEPSFPRFGEEDFTPFINSVIDAKPDGVLISVWGGDLVNFIRQASNRDFFDQGFEVLMTVGGATEVLTALGERMPEGVWLGTRYWYGSHDNDLNKNFVESYQEAYGTPPSYNAEGAYVATYAYKQAIETAGSTDGEAIAKALRGISLETPTGTLKIREGDNQGLIGPTWGKTAGMDEALEIRKLADIRNFTGEEATPEVDPECKM